ncbi:YihY/virulence factor BrkB family protein [Botrimarina mediterranea]|uniref:Uncharacterized protein n=2 Tax=Botrimarina mediterranea TaxID=2528022 RepID=A0A518K5D4_9BACT|nr:YihY/virulence factor BrkB family protein [Botrimarina mediterranea]QDV73013.1 hypothetical protein Spa11_12000 [Botrimarina mediterranea]
MSYFRQVFTEFAADQCTTLAAAISYYTVFALPPLLYLLMMVVTAGLSLAYDSQVAEEKAGEVLEEQATQLIGDEAAVDSIAAMIQRSRQTEGAWWKVTLSVAGVLLAVTGLMGALQTALNVVWAVRPDPDRSQVRYLVRKRAVSFALVLGLGVLLLVSMTVSGAIAYLGDQLNELAGVDPLPAAWINYAVQSLVAFIVFAVVFKVLPDAHVTWRDTFIGALITTALFLVGRIAIQQFFVLSPPGAQLGGAAASLAAVFAWVYYSAMILLFGAEATEVYARRRGRDIQPKSRAVRIAKVME